MTIKINLSKADCFDQQKMIRTLGELIYKNTDLMIHQVAVATGCDLKQASYILFLLYHYYVADVRLLVYHLTCGTDNVPVIDRTLKEGLPEIPFHCPTCDRVITSIDELTFDFRFKILTKDVEFVI